MPNDDDKNTKPRKVWTLWDLFQSKHGPAAFQRMARKPGLTLGEALKKIRDERGEGVVEETEETEDKNPHHSDTEGDR